MKFWIYKDSIGQWRWSLVASNGKNLADSGESYWNKQDCLHGIGLVMSTSAQTPIYER
jgi:uncharacterized protein